MTCEEVQNLLLQSEMKQAPDGVSVHFSGDAAQITAEHVAGHVNQCAECGQLARKLRRLEKAVRGLPEPVGSADAFARFEARLQSMNLAPAAVLATPDEVPVPTMVEPVLSASLESLPHPIRRRKPRMRPNILWRIVDSRLTAAALVMLVIGGSIYAYKWRERQVLASAQTIEVIVEWNLKLVQADTPAERRKVYEASAGLLDQYVVSAPLTSDDRKRAGELIEKGAFLKDNEDPLAEADHFSGVADLLVKKMDLTADASPETMDKLSHTYLSVVDNGIEKNLDRAQAAAKDNPAGQNKIARIDQRNALLMDRVEALVEKHPTSSPPQLQRALAHQRQKSQQRKSEKH